MDYPAQYSRSLFLDLTESLTAEGDWCELADLNILRLSSVSAFGDAAKARVGKVCGIIDPVFGILDGYGAYFQNLYATRNVNIAGTLTAGDENGFSSTFYVGKIHKMSFRTAFPVLSADLWLSVPPLPPVSERVYVSFQTAVLHYRMPVGAKPVPATIIVFHLDKGGRNNGCPFLSGRASCRRTGCGCRQGMDTS